ncbi:serine/threonine protein phosphatase PP2A-associated protein [Rhodotorula toruloides]|uniref:Protein YOP1 n=1 Tax=Rhodotorula toruloides TaxID=5286 RepID=A0A511KI07_RHOTO|nr:serine/threonine protein phosphatase PP2A-associated protein [Rhodotorula toruloides]
MFYYLCKVVSTTSSILYPLFASYKALRPPQSVGRSAQEQHEQMERWLMFWCIMAGVWVWEDWAEWSVRWFPFYHEVKTLAIVWLALPQIQGASYIYINYLSPFLTTHEADIDAALSDVRSSATRMGLNYLQLALRRLRATVLGSFLAEQEAAAAGPLAAHRPPVLAEPGVAIDEQAVPAAAASGLAGLAAGWLRSYGPAAIAAGYAVLRPLGKNEIGACAREAKNRGAEEQDFVDEVGTASGTRAAGSGGEQRRRVPRTRREELEAELVSLSGYSSDGNGSDYHPRPSSSSSASSWSHPASLSPASPAGRPDPVAQRVANEAFLLSASSSFEDIRREEAGEYGGAARPADHRKSGSWFGRGGEITTANTKDTSA